MSEQQEVKGGEAVEGDREMRCVVGHRDIDMDSSGSADEEWNILVVGMEVTAMSRSGRGRVVTIDR
jgi:hypothetical protein